MLNNLQNNKKLPPLANANGNANPAERNNIFERKPLGVNNTNHNNNNNNAQHGQSSPKNIEMSHLNGNRGDNENHNPMPGMGGSNDNQRNQGNRKDRRQGIRKNITDNKITFPQDIPQGDRVGEDFSSDMKDETLTYLLKEVPVKESRYKENLKTGKFLFISKKEMDAEAASAGIDKVHEAHQDEDSQWYKLIDDFNAIIYRFVFLLQGIISGLLIMMAIHYVSDDITTSVQKYGYRLTQVVWIISLITFFGSLYIYRVCSSRFFGVIYVALFVNRYFIAVFSYYDGKLTSQSQYEGGYKATMIIAAIASLFGWIAVGNQTKSNYIEMEYEEEDDRTKIGDDNDEDL